jgi:hypothetical protein
MEGFLRFVVFSYGPSLIYAWKSLYRLSLRKVFRRSIGHGSPAALSTPLLAACRFSNGLGFSRALRRWSRFAGLRFTLRLGLLVADRLRLRDRLGLGIADRLGQHLEQLGPRLFLVTHRSPPRPMRRR